MKQIKKCIIILFIILGFGQIFAQKTPYDSADTQTKQLLSEIDNLITEKKYETAYSKTDDIENEYTLTKRIEIATSYFAQSMMHQMFAFKDLEKDETLHSVRTNDGTFSMVMFDPVEAVKKYVEENGAKPILDYALAVYYDSVYYCYGENWLISIDEIINNIVKYAQSGLDNGYYEDWILSELAVFYRRQNNNNKSYETYTKKQQLGFEFTVDDNYNFAWVLLNKGDTKKAVEYAEKSIIGYKDNAQYQADAFLLCTELYTDLKDYKKAEKKYKEWESKTPEDYRIYFNRIYFYGLQNNKDKSIENAKKLFTYGPSNPSTTQMAMQKFYDTKHSDWIKTYFETLIQEYQKDSLALQNLYFHFAYYYSIEKNNEKCKENAVKAREYFTSNDTLTDEISNMLDSFFN